MSWMAAKSPDMLTLSWDPGLLGELLLEESLERARFLAWSPKTVFSISFFYLFFIWMTNKAKKVHRRKSIGDQTCQSWEGFQNWMRRSTKAFSRSLWHLRVWRYQAAPRSWQPSTQMLCFYTYYCSMTVNQMFLLGNKNSTTLALFYSSVLLNWERFIQIRMAYFAFFFPLEK